MEELENSSSLFNTSPQNKSIDPPKKSIFNTNAVKPISRTTHLSTDVHGYNLGIGESKYDEGITFGTDIDENDIQGSLNEFRAQNQSNLAKVGSGLGRVLTKATTEVLKMPGVLVGSVMAPFAEEGEGFETAFNNQWVKSLNNLNETVNSELLPVYVKKAVSDGNLWDNVSSIDFWATEGADGIGFIASMLAPGAFLKSLNLGNKILGTTAKGMSLANGESKLAGATRLLTNMGVTAEGIDLSAVTLANTFFESGAEAGSAMENFDKGKQDYISRRSLERFRELDLMRRSGNINDEEYNELSSLVPAEVDQEFTQQKGRLGRDIFLSNVAILLGPNAIQSKMIWGKSGARQLVNKTNPSLINKVVNRGKNIGAAMVSEGFFEEGGQSTVENMFTESANKGDLTNNFFKNFNVNEVVDGYGDMISSTDGQKAVFLGGVLGGGMSAYHGAKSDKSNRERTNALLNLAEGTVNNFNTISETDPYVRNEDGSIAQSPRNGKPIYDPVKVNKIGKALALTEQKNLEFEEAVSKGDEETVQRFKDQAINDLIIPFITKGEMGIDSLRQYLEQSKKSVEVESQNDPKDYENLTKSIIDKASYLQKQYESYRDFSKDLVNLDELPDATPEDYTDFYNDLSDFHLNYKADEFTQRQKLQSLNQSKIELIKELDSNRNLLGDNPTFKEGVTEDIYKNERVDSDPRIKKINSEIDKTKEDLREIDETVNNFIWNKEQVNKSFRERVRVNNKLREDNAPQNIEKVDSQIQQINNATTSQQVDSVNTDNPIVNQYAQDKKDEIDDTNLIEEDRKRQLAIDAELQGAPVATEVAESFSGLDFNDNINPLTKGLNESFERNAVEMKAEVVSESYSTLTSTEGSEFTNELTPEQGSNNTNEEVESINSGSIDNGKGVKVISTNRDTGEPFDFILKQFPGYIEFEREPVSKEGRQVGFEINQNPGKVSDKVKKALDLFNKRDFSNEELLYDYLPINIQFTDEIKGPIETKRVNGVINPYTQLLRIEVISRLIQGQSISNIKGSIQGQYKGLLQIDNTQEGVPENNILELDAVNGDIKYIRNNLNFVNSQGLLQNIVTNKTMSFMNPFTKESTRSKENAKGEIYLIIPQANGQPFPLKLNIKKINDIESNIIFDIYREILINEKALNTTISDVNDQLRDNIIDNFSQELNIIGGIKEDITLNELIDLMIYSSNNIKSQVRIENDTLLVGDKIFTIDNIDESKLYITDFLINNKRHQIKIAPKSEIDNTKTNLKSNSSDYLKYLLDNKILNTNAVVNQPTFQGYTNIYINPAVSLQNDVKPINNIKDKLSKIRTVDGIVEAYNTLTPEQQGLYKQFFTDRKIELNNGINVDVVKVSEQGVAISSDNFSMLDFEKVSETKTNPIEVTDNSIQTIEYNNNKYIVNTNKGTIVNIKSGKSISGTSPVGKKVLDKVNFEDTYSKGNSDAYEMELTISRLENMIGDTITATQPFNKGSITGVIQSIVPNPIKKGLFSITLTNGEKVSWRKSHGQFTWVTSNNSENITNNLSRSKELNKLENLKIGDTVTYLRNDSTRDNLKFTRATVTFYNKKTGELNLEGNILDIPGGVYNISDVKTWTNIKYDLIDSNEIEKLFISNIRNYENNFVPLSEADKLVIEMMSGSGRLLTEMSIKEQNLIDSVNMDRKIELSRLTKNDSIDIFKSSSEIPGTVENTEITKVQEEVYEVPTNPKDRKQDIDRLISLNKRIQSGKELRPNELSDYNKFKNAYPQEFEKRCK